MAALNFLSPEQFELLYSGEKPGYEYWFGEAIQKTMPTSLHGILQWVIASLLARHGWMPSVEVRLKLSNLAQPIPDVVADQSPIEYPYPSKPFELCVEILSPGDDPRHLSAKAAHYLDWGIRNVWIIDPDRRKAYVMSKVELAPLELNPDDFFRLGSSNDPLFTPRELFTEVDRYLVRS